jgi:riboflavin kinase / FMN adenylyltransferase
MAVRDPIVKPYDLDHVPPDLMGGCVAIGNFDGVHGGHHRVLDVTLAEAKRRAVPALMLSFEPHPRSLFQPGTPVFRLTPLPVKARLAQALGLDGVVAATFDKSFASLSAEAFIQSVVIERLKATAVIVGHDFQFGHKRSGSAETLAAAGARLGFAVTVVDVVRDAGGVEYASRTIRESLIAGDITAANLGLGYRWFVIGTVVAGDRRGRELGFPTANMRLGDDCRLRHGIYAVHMKRPDGTTLNGVASYGRRPTFDNGPPILEVFAFDFSGDLYGEEVVVTFFDWIRPEERFDGVDALIAAMNRDCEAARAILAAAGPGTALDAALDRQA